MPDLSILATNLHNQLIRLKREMSIAFISIAEILKEIKDSELYKQLGYDYFSEYVQSPEIGLNVRTAYYYIDIYETFIQKFGYKREELMEYSYDKLRKLLPIVNKEDVKVGEIMDNAVALKWSDFEKHYKDEKENSGYEDKLSAPEFYRCKNCGKWVVSLPIGDCCEDFLREFKRIIDKRDLTASKKDSKVMGGD